MTKVRRIGYFAAVPVILTATLLVAQPLYAAADDSVFTKLKTGTLNVTKFIENKKGKLTIKDVLSVTKRAIFKSNVEVQKNLAVTGTSAFAGTVGVNNIDFSDSDTSGLDTSTLTAGALYFDAADLNLYMWDGSDWVDLTTQDTDTDTDTDTTYTAGTGLTLTDTVFAAILGTAIDSSEITDDSIVSSDVFDGTLVAGDIAAGGVGTSEILDDTIAAADIAASAVGTSEILDDTIAAGDIATSGVATAEILDDTILAGDVASGAITTNEILDDTVAAADIANVVRTISFPLTSFIDCQTNGGAEIPFTDATDTLPSFLVPTLDGSGVTILFDDTSGTEDQGSEVCNTFTVPADYASGGELRIRAMKDANDGATEILTSAVAVNLGSLGTVGTATTSTSASTTYTVTPTATYAVDDSIGFYISITSSSTMDNLLQISSVEFAYTATQ